MRLLLIACALMLTACATAHADPLQANPERLQTCITAAGSDRAALEACRGSVARPCIEAEGPGYHSDVLCWSAESEAWRERITVTTAHLATSASYRDAARLNAANQAWSQWAEAECEYWAWEEGGGSGEQVDRVMCDARVSADRAITLILADRNEGRVP